MKLKNCLGLIFLISALLSSCSISINSESNTSSIAQKIRAQNKKPNVEVFVKDSKKGLRRKDDKSIVLPAEYDNISSFNYLTATVKKKDKYGLVDTAGHFLLPLEYDFIDTTYNYGLAKS